MTNRPLSPRAITDRDCKILLCVRDVKLMRLSQIRRMFWPDAALSTAADRLRELVERKWLEPVEVPAAQLAKYDLLPEPTFRVAEGGRQWLRQAGLPLGYPAVLQQSLHELLLAELCVRAREITRPADGVEWYGESQVSFFRSERDDLPLVIPDGLLVLLRGVQSPLAQFIEMDLGREGYGLKRYPISRKLSGYDEFEIGPWQLHPVLGKLPHFPGVLIITSGERRLRNLAQVILARRKAPVGYALTCWSTLAGSANFITAPIWLLIPPGSSALLGEAPTDRRSLPETWLAPEVEDEVAEEPGEGSFLTPSARPHRPKPTSQNTQPSVIRPAAEAQITPEPAPQSASVVVALPEPEVVVTPLPPIAAPTAPVEVNPIPAPTRPVKSKPFPRFGFPLSAWLDPDTSWYLLAAFIMLVLIVDQPPPLNEIGPELSRALTSLSQPTPTATPDPFADVPLFDPLGRQPQPGVTPLIILPGESIPQPTPTVP